MSPDEEQRLKQISQVAEKLPALMMGLAQAIHEQAQAIARLVESNEELLDAIVQMSDQASSETDTDATPSTLSDG